MFGMGFVEIMIIAIVAILFLGPDKLPQTMVEIAKFFRSVKGSVASAKESLESELDATGIKDSLAEHKREFESASNELRSITDMRDIKSDIEEIKNSTKVDLNEESTPTIKATPEVVTFAKKSKKEEDNA